MQTRTPSSPRWRRLGALLASVCALAPFVAAPARAADPCRPHASPTCTSGADARTVPAAASFLGLDSDVRLRGLRLPTFAGVLGAKRGPARRSKLDGALRRLLIAPLAEPDAGAAGVHIASLRPAAAGAGDDPVVQVLANQHITAGGATLERRVIFETDINRCPTQLSSAVATSDVRLEIAATYELTAHWTVGRQRVTRSILIRLLPTNANASVNDDARFKEFKAVTSLDSKVRVESSGEVRAPGKRPQRYTFHVDLVVNPAQVGWDAKLDTGTDDFGRMIAREEGLPLPPGWGRALAAESAYAQLVRAFMQMVDAELIRTVARAERVWQTPNACAELSFDPRSGTAHIAAGGEADLLGRIVAKSGEGVDGFRGLWPSPAQTIGRIVDWTSGGSKQGRPWQATVEGGTPQGGLSVKFHFRVPSTVGVVDGDWTALDGGPPSFVIDAVESTQTSSITATAPPAACPLTGTQTRHASIGGPQPFDPSNNLQGDEATGYNGAVSAVVAGGEDGTLHGCDLRNPPAAPPCTFMHSEAVMVVVAFTVTIKPHDPMAELHWFIGPADIGFHDVGFPDSDCYFGPSSAQADPTAGVTTVSRDVFFATTSQTVTVGGNFSRDSGIGVVINSSYGYKITLHAVPTPAPAP